jgi:hypothetical protein
MRFSGIGHLRYPDSLAAFKEMVRIGRKFVVINMPNSILFGHSIPIQELGENEMMISAISIFSNAHEFDGEHYWELKKKDYRINKVITDIDKYCDLKHSKRLFENLYHHFFVFKKRQLVSSNEF